MALRRRPLGLVLALPALTVPMAASPAAAVQAPPTRPLPSALDVYVPYQGQTICDPVARPGVLAFARLMTSHYGMGSTALIGRTCGSGPSEHYDGRAWDWMLNVNNPAQEAVAQSVLAWLTAPDRNGVKGAMARRFGIMYIIHDRKMWRSYATERGWAPYYGSRRTPTTSTSASTTTAPPAAPRGGPACRRGATSPRSRAGGSVPTTPTTPPIPAPTTPVPSEAGRAVVRHALGGRAPAAGAAGQPPDDRLLRRPDEGPCHRLPGLRRACRRPAVADLRTQEILAARGWRSVAAAYPTLTFGMTSAAVRTLQTKLGSLPTTGYYGSMTRARVTAYQKFAGCRRPASPTR